MRTCVSSTIAVHSYDGLTTAVSIAEKLYPDFLGRLMFFLQINMISSLKCVIQLSYGKGTRKKGLVFIVSWVEKVPMKLI